MNWQNDVRSILKEEIARRKSEGRSISLRKMAKEFDISPALLSRFLAGQLDIAQPSAAKIVSSLEHFPERRDLLLATFGEPIRRKPKTLPPDGRILLNNWVYFAVWAFFDLPVELRSVKYIAKKLDANESEVKEAVDALVEKGFLVAGENGMLAQAEPHWALGNGPADADINRFHQDSLQVAKRALQSIPSGKRQFSNITFSGDPELMDWARKEIIETVRRISARFDGAENKSEVYRLNVSLFPLNFEQGPT